MPNSEQACVISAGAAAGIVFAGNFTVLPGMSFTQTGTGGVTFGDGGCALAFALRRCACFKVQRERERERERG